MDSALPPLPESCRPPRGQLAFPGSPALPPLSWPASGAVPAPGGAGPHCPSPGLLVLAGQVQSHCGPWRAPAALVLAPALPRHLAPGSPWSPPFLGLCSLQFPLFPCHPPGAYSLTVVVPSILLSQRVPCEASGHYNTRQVLDRVFHFFLNSLYLVNRSIVIVPLILRFFCSGFHWLFALFLTIMFFVGFAVFAMSSHLLAPCLGGFSGDRVEGPVL